MHTMYPYKNDVCMYYKRDLKNIHYYIIRF